MWCEERVRGVVGGDGNGLWWEGKVALWERRARGVVGMEGEGVMGGEGGMKTAKETVRM